MAASGLPFIRILQSSNCPAWPHRPGKSESSCVDLHPPRIVSIPCVFLEVCVFRGGSSQAGLSLENRPEMSKSCLVCEYAPSLD